MKTIKTAFEYSSIYPEGISCSKFDTILPKKSFDNLWNFILENSDSDMDAIMSIHTKLGKRYIKTSKYVGTLQTRDGLSIEILPKIYDHDESNKEPKYDVDESRAVFLKMLAALSQEKAKTFQFADVESRKNFPILEYYISNYIQEVEKLLSYGLKNNYTKIDENQKFLKGKLLINKQIAKNAINKEKFYVRYAKYLLNIPQNRILRTTLDKLFMTSGDLKNRNHLKKLQLLFEEIPFSENIDLDLQQALNGNRTFSKYDLLMKWSAQILKGKGFTPFAGEHYNQALLFSAEKLFECYIAKLFKKYARDYITNSQHSKYYLIDRHRTENHGVFKIRPDMFLDAKNSDKAAQGFESQDIIIDTKWKCLEEKNLRENYLIDVKDIYQLFAYGEKYGLKLHKGNIKPILILLYPCTKNFKNPLPRFDYYAEDNDYGLYLYVLPFDLSEKEPQIQIQKILNLVREHKDFNSPEDISAYWTLH